MDKFLFIFVPMLAFAIGGLISQAIMIGRKLTFRHVFVVMAVCVGYLTLAFTVPFLATPLEIIYLFAGIAAVTAAMTCIIIDQESRKQTTAAAGCVCGFSVLIFLPLVLFTAGARAGQACKIATKFDGLVTAKYRSSDHNMPSITVTDQDGSTTTIEGVDLPAWNMIVAQKSRVQKPAWSPFGQVDGQSMRIIPQGSVMFLGPFLD